MKLQGPVTIEHPPNYQFRMEPQYVPTQIQRPGQGDLQVGDLNQRVSEVPLNFHHPYLMNRSVSPEWAEYMGIGEFESKILVSIHDLYGKFAGYVPRVLDNRTEPKYDFTGLAKTHYLYNYHRARQARRRAVLVVEGFFGTVRLLQTGHPSTVGLMGTAMSELQEQYLTRYWDYVILMLDGDKSGQQAQDDHSKRLMKRGLKGVFKIVLPDKTQPDDFNADQINAFLANPVQSS